MVEEAVETVDADMPEEAAPVVDDVVADVVADVQEAAQEIEYTEVVETPVAETVPEEATFVPQSEENTEAAAE